jgi:hypothetical protein
VIRVSTPSLPAAASKPGTGTANAPSVGRGVLLWGAAVVIAISAALGVWWGSSSDDAAAATSVPAPVSAAQVTRHPREQCAGRHLIALHRCLVRQCEKPEFQMHRDCERVREIETRTRSVLGD